MNFETRQRSRGRLDVCTAFRSADGPRKSLKRLSREPVVLVEIDRTASGGAEGKAERKAAKCKKKKEGNRINESFVGWAEGGAEKERKKEGGQASLSRSVFKLNQRRSGSIN